MPKVQSKTLTMVAAALAAATISSSSGPGYAQTKSASRQHVVEIRDFKFSTPALTIRKGDTVEWINRDIVPHTATQNEASWDTGALAWSQSGRVTFTVAGAQEYICQFHPEMRGKIMVQAK
jgi:plastocyanin